MTVKRDHFKILGIVAFVLLVACLYSYRKRGGSESKSKQTAETIKLVRELAQRHNADPNWERPLNDDMYTIEIEELLVSSAETQPILLIGPIHDEHKIRFP